MDVFHPSDGIVHGVRWRWIGGEEGLSGAVVVVSEGGDEAGGGGVGDGGHCLR